MLQGRLEALFESALQQHGKKTRDKEWQPINVNSSQKFGAPQIKLIRHHVTLHIIISDDGRVSRSVIDMSHNHDHDHNCGDHAHDHDHTDTGGPSDNVFTHIDRDNVIALNSIGEGKQVIKPWNERLDEQVVSICPLEGKKK